MYTCTSNSLSTSGRIHGYLPHFSINGTNTYVSKAMKTNSTTRARHTHVYTHTQDTHKTHTQDTHVKLISNSNKYWRKEEKTPNDGGDITRGFFLIGLNVVCCSSSKDVHIIFYLDVPPPPPKLVLPSVIKSISQVITTICFFFLFTSFLLPLGKARRRMVGRARMKEDRPMGKLAGERKKKKGVSEMVRFTHR